MNRISSGTLSGIVKHQSYPPIHYWLTAVIFQGNIHHVVETNAESIINNTVCLLTQSSAHSLTRSLTHSRNPPNNPSILYDCWPQSFILEAFFGYDVSEVYLCMICNMLLALSNKNNVIAILTNYIYGICSLDSHELA